MPVEQSGGMTSKIGGEVSPEILGEISPEWEVLMCMSLNISFAESKDGEPSKRPIEHSSPDWPNFPWSFSTRVAGTSRNKAWCFAVEEHEMFVALYFQK